MAKYSCTLIGPSPVDLTTISMVPTCTAPPLAQLPSHLPHIYHLCLRLRHLPYFLPHHHIHPTTTSTTATTTPAPFLPPVSPPLTLIAAASSLTPPPQQATYELCHVAGVRTLAVLEIFPNSLENPVWSPHCPLLWLLMSTHSPLVLLRSGCQQTALLGTGKMAQAQLHSTVST